jgi:purine-binding chemotaxis protein CheW
MVETPEGNRRVGSLAARGKRSLARKPAALFNNPSLKTDSKLSKPVQIWYIRSNIDKELRGDLRMMTKVVVFHAGREEYALPIHNVVSIEKLEKINPVPQLPPYVLGLIKVRDELIPVLDLSTILYNEVLNTDEGLFLLVLHTETLQVGLVVKEAKEILEVADASVTNVGLLAYSKTKYFNSVINLEDRIITMIDPDVLVDSLEGIKEIKDYVHKQKASQN